MNWRFNENDIAFGIVGIDEIERIHRELAYACAELGANRFGHRFRANITGGFNCVEDVEDYFFETKRALFLGMLSVAIPVSVAVTFGAVAAVGACTLPVTHAGVLAFSFACIDPSLRKQIAQLAHAHGGAFFG